MVVFSTISGRCRVSTTASVELIPHVGNLRLLRFVTLMLGPCRTKDTLLLIGGACGAIVCGAALPLFTVVFGETLDKLGSGGADIASSVMTMVYYFTGLAVISFVSGFAEVALWMIPAARNADRLRIRALQATMRQDISWFDTHKDSSGVLASVQEDSSLVQRGTGEKVGNFIHHITCCSVGLGVGMWRSWEVTLLMLGMFPILGGVSGGLAKITTWMTSRSAQAYAAAGSTANESISNVRTLAAFGAEEKATNLYRAKLAEPMRMGKIQGWVAGLTIGFTQFSFLGSFALALWFGSIMVASGRNTGGDVVAALFAGLIAGFAVGQAIPNLTHFASARMAGARLVRRIEQLPEIDEENMDGMVIHPDDLQGHVELREVDFRYPARPTVQVLKKFNLVVPAGQTVALVGESGSGKSTVIGLIERFYDPESGAVTLDGVDIRDIRVSSLRSSIGLVSQEPALFACTIGENISYGRPGATQAEIEAAAQAANAHKFISALPDGYDTFVGERGVQLSGGQKQRIAIARAVLRNPKVLLLDEATSALDSESERVVQEALDSLMVGRTTIVIAHRLSTIQNADKICVVQHGEITEEGTHKELIARGGAYASLVSLQAH